MGLQYSITAIGAIILQFYVNALGEDAIAGFTSGYKIKNLILCPLNYFVNHCSEVELGFSKASAKVLTIFETAKCFRKKVAFLSQI